MGDEFEINTAQTLLELREREQKLRERVTSMTEGDPERERILAEADKVADKIRSEAERYRRRNDG